jgi:hypothetical protein
MPLRVEIGNRPNAEASWQANFQTGTTRESSPLSLSANLQMRSELDTEFRRRGESEAKGVAPRRALLKFGVSSFETTRTGTDIGNRVDFYENAIELCADGRAGWQWGTEMLAVGGVESAEIIKIRKEAGASDDVRHAGSGRLEEPSHVVQRQIGLRGDVAWHDDAIGTDGALAGNEDPVPATQGGGIGAGIRRGLRIFNALHQSTAHSDHRLCADSAIMPRLIGRKQVAIDGAASTP